MSTTSTLWRKLVSSRVPIEKQPAYCQDHQTHPTKSTRGMYHKRSNNDIATIYTRSQTVRSATPANPKISALVVQM